MKQKIIVVVSVLILLVTAFLTGRRSGMHVAIEQQTKQQLQRDLQLHRELVELDRLFLPNIPVSPNTMTSGSYTLETWIAGKPEENSVLKMEFADGKLVKLPPRVPIQDIQQTENVISWERYDMHEGPSAIFIGLIDGNEMWGRVYVEPGQGWREGEPPAYGVWRLYRTANRQ